MARLSAVCLIVSHQFYSLILIDDKLWKVGQTAASLWRYVSLVTFTSENLSRGPFYNTSYRSGFSSCPSVAYVGHLTRNCYHFFPVWPLSGFWIYTSGAPGWDVLSSLSFIWCVAAAHATVIPNKNSFVSGSAHRAQTHHMLRQSKRCVKRRPVAVVVLLSCFWHRR